MSNTETEKDNELPENPKRAILVSIIAGCVIICGAFYIYQDILELEVTGGTRRVQWMIYLVYQALGAKGVLVAISSVGLFCFYHAYRLYRKLKG